MATKNPQNCKKHQLPNNGLHLNPSKSEAITFFNPGSKPVQTLAESSWVHLCCGFTYQTSRIWVSISAPDYLSTNSYLKHVKRHISTSVPCIRSYLTTEAAKTVTSVIVGSRLDYCNALLAGTSVHHLARLQLVQNTFARVVAQKSRFDHITPVMSELCSV